MKTHQCQSCSSEFATKQVNTITHTLTSNKKCFRTYSSQFHDTTRWERGNSKHSSDLTAAARGTPSARSRTWTMMTTSELAGRQGCTAHHRLVSRPPLVAPRRWAPQLRPACSLPPHRMRTRRRGTRRERRQRLVLDHRMHGV